MGGGREGEVWNLVRRWLRKGSGGGLGKAWEPPLKEGREKKIAGTLGATCAGQVA